MRQSGMGIGPLTYTEIEAYIRLTGAILHPWEIRALRLIDKTFRAAMSD